MITIILSWTMLFLTFLSFGEMAVYAWNKLTRRKDSYSITDKFWIGICTIGVLLLYISLFFPLTIVVLGLLLLIAGINIIAKRHQFKEYFTHTIKKIRLLSTTQKVIFALCLLTVLTYSLSTSTIYDQGLYHLQTMQWTERFPVITGLGNLHGRLAFNSTFLLLSTVFNYHPDINDTAFTLNGLGVLAFSFWLLKRIMSSDNIIKKIVLSFTLIVLTFIVGTSISSSSTDILPGLMLLYILFRWILSSEKSFVTNKGLLLGLLSIFCITLKLSSAAILLVTLLTVVSYWIQKDRRSACIIVIIGALVAMPWLTRFFLLSGYLVYPFPAVDIFAVDWKIPLEMVQLEKDAAYAWAKLPDRDFREVLAMSISEWAPLWYDRVSFFVSSIFGLALISPILFLVGARKIKKRHKTIAWGIAYSGVIFSIATAPDIRFAFGYLIAAITLPILQLEINLGDYSKYLKNFYYIILFIGFTYLSVSAYHLVEFYRPLSTMTTAELIYKPLPTNARLKRDQVRFTEYMLNDITLYVPEGTVSCIDQPLPCANQYNSNLEMRGDRLENGFRIKK